MSDTAPALIALDAEAEILGAAGLRHTRVEDLFTGNGVRPHALAQDDIVRAILVPAPPPRAGWGYRKSARRGGLEFGIAVMAATLSATATGACAGARIVIGAVRERPVRLVATEQALVGVQLDESMVGDAAASAAREIDPLPHHGFTKSYVRDDIRTKIRRVLAAAVAQARSGAEDLG
jgi:CO/xanthine dehydrogenase FAD-binding subunit